MAAVLTFWISLFGIAYAYAGYPAILWLISRFSRTRERIATAMGAQPPTVTMMISAYNEEEVIGQKIANSLSLDYPQDLLEIVVVSDGSTDRTHEIVLTFADKGVVLRHYEGRIGKTACLNLAVPLATGRIIVFSDANSTYERGALRALVQPFEDPRVGFVTGWTKYTSGEDGSTTLSVGLYSRLELITKHLESQLGSCVGADGAIFAIRQDLYVPLKNYDINDFVLPLSINERGYRGVLQRDAICFEQDAGGTRGEFHRQVRITSRTIRAIMNYRQLLNPIKFGVLSFKLFSHKVCKFLVPLLMMALLVSNLLLIEQGSFYTLFLVTQGIFYALVLVAAFAPAGGLLDRKISPARTFVMVNAAMAIAWIKYWRGETYTTWSPTKR